MLENIDATAGTAPAQLLNVHRFVTRAVGHTDIKVNLTVRHIAVLTTIRLKVCPLGVKGISDYLRINKVAVCHALDRLSELNLVLRETNSHDLRTINVVLTPLGERLVDAIGTD